MGAKLLVTLLGAICLLSPAARAVDSPALSAIGYVPAETLDLLGDSLGSFGSGTAYDSKSDCYLFVADRGAGDGHIDFQPRFHRGKITTQGPVLQFSLLQTTRFRDESGAFFTGLLPDRTATAKPRMRDGRFCMDPEAIAVAQDGSIYVADEYGPFLYQFGPDGRFRRCFQPPAHYLPRTSPTEIDFRAGAHLVSGRVPNHGFEGLTLLPGGEQAALILQSALIQDGGEDSPYTRLLLLDLKSGQPAAEYVYPLATPAELARSGPAKPLKANDISVSELLALDAQHFLVLERDNRGANGSANPKKPQHKVVYRIDLQGATNLLLKPGAFLGRRDFVPVRKTLCIDLVAATDRFGLREPMAAKWEGLALGPQTANGSAQLLITCDNDFLTPKLTFNGVATPFPRARRPLSTQLLLFNLPRTGTGGSIPRPPAAR